MRGLGSAPEQQRKPGRHPSTVRVLSARSLCPTTEQPPAVPGAQGPAVCADNDQASLPVCGMGWPEAFYEALDYLPREEHLVTFGCVSGVASPVLGSGTQSLAGSSPVGCHRTAASHPGAACSWPRSLPAPAAALLGPEEGDLGVKSLTVGIGCRCLGERGNSCALVPR